MKRQPIRYVQVDSEPPLPFAEVESIILHGDFLFWDPLQIRLGQIGDGGNRRPEIFEFTCEMDGGLLATFRSDEYGIPGQFSKVPPETHAARHQAAFIVSHMMGIEHVPMNAPRSHPSIGDGTLTALLEGESFLFVDLVSRGTKGYRIPPRAPTALAEAYIMDYILGSGQRAESSYVVCPDGFVRSQYHHEAFSWTESKRLITAFTETRQTVSPDFWEALRKFGKTAYKQDRMRNLLLDLIKPASTDRLFQKFEEVLSSRSMGREYILVE